MSLERTADALRALGLSAAEANRVLQRMNDLQNDPDITGAMRWKPQEDDDEATHPIHP